MRLTARHFANKDIGSRKEKAPSSSICISTVCCMALIILMVLTISVAMAAEKATTLEEITVKENKIEERLSAELAEYGHKVEIVSS